jgi:hypothetical protein
MLKTKTSVADPGILCRIPDQKDPGYKTNFAIVKSFRK